MFEKKPKTIVYFILSLVVFFVILIPSKFFQPVKFFVIEKSLGPVRFVSMTIRETKKLLFYHRIFDAYVDMREERDILKGRLVGLEEVVRENSRLEALLKLKRQLVYPSVAASVIGRDSSNWNSSLLIDRGIGDGIQIGMPVVNAQGVVGKIAEVGQHKSKVLLVSDPSFSVVAVVVRSREIGVVSGTLQGLSRMRYLSDEADVMVGDQIITSRISSAFPEGLMVGEVVEVNSSQKSPTVRCLINPAVTLSQIEEVIIIKKLES